MATNTKLMTAAEVITEVIPNSSFDEQLLDLNIVISQRKYIKTALGEDMYDNLLDETATFLLTGSGYTGRNKELMEEWLKPCLSRFIVYEGLPVMRNNLTSQGVIQNFSEFGSQSDRFDFGQMRDKFFADGSFLRDDMLEFICDNKGDFTLFKRNLDKHANKTGVILYGKSAKLKRLLRRKRRNLDELSDLETSGLDPLF